MSSLSITMMFLICGIVWGGFVGLIVKAIRSEGAKSKR